MLTVAGAGLPDWLQGVGGLGAFLATIVLAVIAGRQMGAIRGQAEATERQAEAAREQLRLQREAAEEEARQRTAEEGRRFNADWEAKKRHQEQLEALIEQGQATRDATRAQLQPLVYGHRKGAPRFGPIPPDAYG